MTLRPLRRRRRPKRLGIAGVFIARPRPIIALRLSALRRRPQPARGPAACELRAAGPNWAKCRQTCADDDDVDLEAGDDGCGDVGPCVALD